MMALLVAFVVATNPGASTCATVSNVENTATWLARDGRRITATYRDAGGARLVFDRPVPGVVRMAEASLVVGARGPKVVTVCR